jgi:methyl-accepting chemotaxis protein
MFKSLKTKLLCAFAVVALATGMGSFFGLRALHSVDALLVESTKDIAPSNAYVHGIQTHFYKALWMTGRGIVAANNKQQNKIPELRKARDQAFQDVDKAIADFNRIPIAPLEVEPWQELCARFREYRGINDRIWQALDAGDPKQAAELVESNGPARDVLMAAADRMESIESQRLAQISEEGDSVRDSATALVWTVSVLGVLTAIAFGILITLSISRPVGQLRAAALRIAQGDIKQKIEHRGADEIGMLADSFRALVEYMNGVAEAAAALGRGNLSTDVQPKSEADLLAKNMSQTIHVLRGLMEEVKGLIGAAQVGDLSKRAEAAKYQGGYAELLNGMNRVLEAVSEPMHETSRVLERLADSDLTARGRDDFQGEYKRMTVSLNKAAENLQASLLQVSVTSEQVATASSQIAASSQSVAQGASEQASALEETSSALIEMAAATKRNAESAVQANVLADSARNASNNGSAAMQQMTSAMSQIRTSAEGTAAIIRDINDIAFQTNLLALNAAVEAARAGEAGRGFAVVAEEVRNLALRSKEAAKKTEQLIGESMALTKQGEEISGRVGGTLGEIVGSVTRVSEIVSHIARASQEQAEGIEQSQRAMTQMDQATQQAAANSEETSSAAEELAAQAQELTVLVGHFQLGTNAANTQVKKTVRALPTRKAAPVPRANTYVQRGIDSGGATAKSLIPIEDDPDFREF